MILNLIIYKLTESTEHKFNEWPMNKGVNLFNASIISLFSLSIKVIKCRAVDSTDTLYLIACQLLLSTISLRQFKVSFDGANGLSVTYCLREPGIGQEGEDVSHAKWPQ